MPQPHQVSLFFGYKYDKYHRLIQHPGPLKVNTDSRGFHGKLAAKLSHHSKDKLTSL